MRLVVKLGIAGIGLALSWSLSPSADAQTEKVIVNFNSSSGSNPVADLLADDSGALYGTTFYSGRYGSGTVFKLTPPAAGSVHWTDMALYTFVGGLDGGTPTAGLAPDAQGSLYGATVNGGRGCNGDGCGAVFKLTPPAGGGSGPWTNTPLHDFDLGVSGANGADGNTPIGGVVLDPQGNIYGTTQQGGYYVGPLTQGGVIFELSPTSPAETSYKYAVLHYFQGLPDGDGPVAAMILDAGGALYGTTPFGGNTDCLQKGCGVVFRLNPPAAGKSAWTETVLHRFAYVAGPAADGRAPMAALIADANGTLYGTTEQGGSADLGTVFELTPPPAGQTAWTERVLYSFTGNSDGAHPVARLVLTSRGTLAGTTANGGVNDWGTVFELTPPAAGQTTWTERQLYRFPGPVTANAYPEAGLTEGADGTLYGTTYAGAEAKSCPISIGCGTVFAITP